MSGHHLHPKCEAVELPLLVLDVPHMRACLDRWDQTRHGRWAPSEREADPLSVTMAVGSTGLIDVVQMPLDFRFRYFGPVMATGQGLDYTGHLVSEIKPAGYAATIRSGYEKVLSERRPRFEHIVFNDDLRKRSYFRLLMPLSEDGLKILSIWAVTHYYQGPWRPNWA